MISFPLYHKAFRYAVGYGLSITGTQVCKVGASIYLD